MSAISSGVSVNSTGRHDGSAPAYGASVDRAVPAGPPAGAVPPPARPGFTGCSASGLVSTASMNSTIVVPSSRQCSPLMPAEPSGNTMKVTPLSNQRLPGSPASRRLQRSAVRGDASGPAGTAALDGTAAPDGSSSSSATQNSAASTTSRTPWLPLSAASRAARLRAHPGRALEVRAPVRCPVPARALAAATSRSTLASSSSEYAAPSGPITSTANTAPREKTRMCRSPGAPSGPGGTSPGTGFPDAGPASTGASDAP